MLTIAIQAGGKSSRMGANKAKLPFLGTPLIERVIYRVEPLAANILIVTNHPEEYQNISYPKFPDIESGLGALGGLRTALVHSQTEFVANVACDMPFVNPALLNFFLDLINEDPTADVVIPRTEHGFEPMHAVYRRSSCLPAVEASLRDGQQRMIAWFDQVEVRAIPGPVLDRFDPLKQAFINLNTPEELALAEAHARKTGI